MSCGYVALLCLLLRLTSHLSVAQDENLQLRIKPSGEKQIKAIGENLFLSCHPPSDSLKRFSNVIWTTDSYAAILGNAAIAGLRKYTDDIEVNGTGLFIANITQDDQGDYTCSATVDGTTIQSVVRLETFLDITWIDTPEVQHPVAGTNATIKCRVKSQPVPTVDWHKSGKQFDPSQETHRRCNAVEDGIFCAPITTDDNGQYTCRARVTDTGRHQKRFINVTVHVIPKIKEISDMGDIIEDETVFLQCQATGKPEPTYTWFDKNNADLTGRPGYKVDSRSGSLTIDKVTKDDAGILKCLAKNVAGEAEESFKLIVIVKPRIESFDDVVVTDGEMAIMQCHVQAVPKPSVAIQKLDNSMPFVNEIQSSDERVRIFENPDGVTNLEISGVRRSDDGEYTCSATNGGGSVSLVGRLTVQFAPVFSSTPYNDLTSWKFHVINITCEATSIPDATIEWIFDGKVVNKDSNLLVFGNGPVSSIQVTPIDESYFGIYVCRARNSIGESEHKVEFKEAFPPGPILQPVFDLITATTITFNFKGPRDNGGMPIEGFAVRYIEDGQSWSDHGFKERQWPLNTPFILEKLEPEKKYHFQFAASNKVGFGNWTQSIHMVMPKKAAPGEPRIAIVRENEREQLISPYPNKFELKWTAPADNGENITSFDITYRPMIRFPNGTYERIGDLKIHNVTYPGETTLQLLGLQPDTIYKIEIRALNSIGYSLPGELYVRTAKDPGLDSAKAQQANAELNNDMQVSTAGMPVGVTAAIIAVIIVVLLIAIDLICFFVKKCGIIMCVCVHVCNHPATKQADTDEGKMKDSKQTKAHDVVYDQNDFDSKDASEDTPMIDGKGDKERQALKDAMENDMNMKNKSPRGSKSSIAKDSAV